MSNLSVKATTHQNLTNNMLENTEAVQEIIIIIIIIMDRFMKLMRVISDAQLLKYSHQRKIMTCLPTLQMLQTFIQLQT